MRWRLRLGYERVRICGHDIGLMVAYAYAAQYPAEVERIVLMDAFLPGVGAWENVWLLHDKWHFNFYGETPLKLVKGRERIYFEHFWNDFAADPKKSVSERDRRFYAQILCAARRACGPASRCSAPSSRTAGISPNLPRPNCRCRCWS